MVRFKHFFISPRLDYPLKLISLHLDIVFYCTETRSFIMYHWICSDVKAVSKDTFASTSTTISCEITGLSTKATVIWKKGSETQDGTAEGVLGNDGSQVSTLTVADPQNDEVYTCVVTSGEHTSSDPSEAVVNLNTFCKS